MIDRIYPLGPEERMHQQDEGFGVPEVGLGISFDLLFVPQRFEDRDFRNHLRIPSGLLRPDLSGRIETEQ